MTFSQISLGAERTNTNETSSCENLYSSRIWKYQVAVNNQMGKCEEILEDKTETWTEALQHLELTIGPVLMICGFLAKLLRQVIQSLQTADLSQKPLLISFLRLLQALPCSGNVLRTKWKIKKITKQNWLSSNTNNDKDSGYWTQIQLGLFNPGLRFIKVMTYGHHLALRGHERGAVADAQLGLKGVEVNF